MKIDKPVHPETRTKLQAHMCKLSFWRFIKTFWSEVPGAGTLIENWHMQYLADELQEVAERIFKNQRKKYDLLINVAPGTSKSTITSILFPAWFWTRMPCGRMLTASHTDSLVLDLSNKSRTVIKSELYRTLFPDVEFSDTQDSKEYFTNTAGGDRKTCTVGGKTPMGSHSHVSIIDDPLDPQTVLSEVETKTAAEFVNNIITTRVVDKEVSVRILVMQRLGLNDPTHAMLEQAKAEGAVPVKHICLPAELSRNEDGSWCVDNVQPPELVEKYVDGLFDPIRMSRYALGGFKARGNLFYATQFLQQPYSPEGGMFKPWYFNKRVAAAPYECKRIRFWDRASTADGGCYTAGVLMARDKEGLFYVEHVVHGQWEPIERNNIMRSTALRDRAKYGRYEPVIHVEAEGGSSGKDAWIGVMKALAGFVVKETRVSGRKDTRAEPWSSQLAGGGVFLVEDGSWNINNYIEEHIQFKPDVVAKRLGRYKDQVDSSASAFTLLANIPQIQGISVYKLGKPMKGQHRFILCNKQELEDLIIEDQRCLLVCVDDPYPVGSDLIPTHGLHNLLGVLSLQFAYINPRDYQDKWEQAIEPYGKKCEELVISQDQGKKLFAFILKKRDPCPTVFVICDDNKERRETVALAICDVLSFQRNKLIYSPGSADMDYGAMKPENEHLFTVVKNSRSLVVV